MTFKLVYFFFSPTLFLSLFFSIIHSFWPKKKIVFHFFVVVGLFSVNKQNAVTEKIKWKSQPVYIHCIRYGLLFQIKFIFERAELKINEKEHTHETTTIIQRESESESEREHVLRVHIVAYHLSCRYIFLWFYYCSVHVCVYGCFFALRFYVSWILFFRIEPPSSTSLVFL